MRDNLEVILNPPPCKRSFRLVFRPNGELRMVEIDGVYYAVVKRKRTTLLLPGDRGVTLVEVVQRYEGD